MLKIAHKAKTNNKCENKNHATMQINYCRNKGNLNTLIQLSILQYYYTVSFSKIYSKKIDIKLKT